MFDWLRCEIEWPAGMCRLMKLTALAGSLALSGYAQVGPAFKSASRGALVSTDGVGSHRFVAAHGRRGLIEGYADGGLDAWIYPFQIFRGYHVAFLPQGATTPVKGEDIFARVEYEPDSITRVYLGPGFIAREKLFVPVDEPGAILTYTVHSSNPVAIEVHTKPVLNLMWPAALGGQDIGWNRALNAFLLSEPLHGYSAVVGSPNIAAHDEIENRADQGEEVFDLGFTLHPDGSGSASVFLALNQPHASDSGAAYHKLIGDKDSLEAESAAHYKDFLSDVIEVTTPDDEVNRAIASAEIALDQAWVCSVDLGCGYVAGYGPSRGARRPQYDWFFAGDGLVATDAAIAAGNLKQARDELCFILRYQDRKTGMIWHELSQSAGLIDWAGKYPYMYVHVDITFQFLATVGRYVSTTGDTAFVRENWSSIEQAYRYCLSIIDPSTSLPRIPPDKEGGNEQNRMSDDLGLSASWVAASAAVREVAALTGDSGVAEQAARAGAAARQAISRRFWNDRESFWISGHSMTGEAMKARTSGPGEALTMHVFNEKQSDEILDQIASASFQTDWGTRGIAAGSAGFDPESYAAGSVWPVGTAALATAMWSEHRPVSAMQLWNSLLPLSSLDSIGHIHEVLAGNFYRPQTESVPEQTWSSAGFLQATIEGLLGLKVDSIDDRVVFAPRLPVDWPEVSIQHIALAKSMISLTLQRSVGEMSVKIDNQGDMFHFEFAPDLPLGAKLIRTAMNGHTISGKIEEHRQQTNAMIEADIPRGKSELELTFSGGVSVIPETVKPQLGAASSGMRIIDVSLEGRELIIDVDVPSDRESRLQLQTPWPVTGDGTVSVERASPTVTVVTFAAIPGGSVTYRRARAVLRLNN